MAIRLRYITGEGWLALCAARSVEKEGDVYLDDNQHNALANKFARDHNDMFDTDIPGVYDDAAAVEREESNNMNRTLWDEWYGEGGRFETEWQGFLAAAEWVPSTLEVPL